MCSILAPSSYPRLHVPAQFPRQSDSNTSPATILLSGKMYEIVLDGTEDGNNSVHASDSQSLIYRQPNLPNTPALLGSI